MPCMAEVNDAESDTSPNAHSTFKSIQRRTVTGGAIQTADFESVFEEEWDDARACEACCACNEDFHSFLLPHGTLKNAENADIKISVILRASVSD